MNYTTEIKEIDGQEVEVTICPTLPALGYSQHELMNQVLGAPAFPLNSNKPMNWFFGKK